MPSLILAYVLFVTNQAAQPDVAARAKELIGFLAAGKFADVEAQFDEKMTAAMPAGRLGTTWTTILNQAGPFKSCGADVRVVSIADKQMVISPCEFERAKLDVQFAFDANGKVSGMVMRPAAAPPVPYAFPSYANPALYGDTDVTVGSGEWALPGTLSLPTGPGPFPAVVLVHGSGPNDRDETIGASKPFKDLAAGLASNGIAVLRYDKRTKVHGAKLAGVAFTVREEVVDDVLEAVRTLRANPKIDRARVFVAGHSLGAMLMPRVGAADPSLAGLIVMASPARSVEEAILEQTRYLAMADGTISPAEQKAIDDAVSLGAKVKALKPEDAGSTTSISGAPAAYWLDLRNYDAPSAAKRVKAPMLVLQGERDYQVTMPEFEKWKAALAGRGNVTFHSYPSLNHLFIAGTGKSLPAEYQTPGHVADDVVRDIAAWIKRGPGL